VSAAARTQAAVERLDVSVYEVPTDEPESDGTLAWDSTTIVVVEAHAGETVGLGYTYGPGAVSALIREKLAPIVCGWDAIGSPSPSLTMERELRNAGRPGVGAMAVAAVDVALWDLKARLLDLPLVDVLPRVHESVPVYGSGGFTSYSLERLEEQLGGWVLEGIPRVKIKVGRDPERDPERLSVSRAAIGRDTELFVDANGAFTAKRALAWAERYAFEWDVTWFEEPVSSADFDGLRLVRERGPAGLEIAAGEYAYVLADVRNLLVNGCVDCLQLDVTRCGGITGLLEAAGFAAGFGVDVSAHCAPAISAHAFTAVSRLRHLEYFHDHVRVEQLLFDGVLEPVDGALRPDRSRPGHGLELKRADAERFAA
jgi:L-alanine-DL-glutamate epimerase-like enolase superfamily enzyme